MILFASGSIIINILRDRPRSMNLNLGEKSLKQTIASDALKLTTSKIITMSISMISAMLLSRFRTLEEYGTYSQIMLVVNLFTTIFMVGLPNSINFFLARTEDLVESERFLSVFYSLSTGLSIIAGLVLAMSVPLIENYFDNTYISKFVYVLVLFPWAKIIMSTIDNILIVYKKTNYILIYRVLNSLCLLLIIILVECFHLGFEHYMILFIVVEALFAFSVYFIVKKIAGKIRLFTDVVLIKTILKFSIPIGLATTVGTFKKELDKLMIGWFYDTESLAIYTNAARELPVVIIASTITAVLLPQLVRMIKKDEYQKTIELWSNSILFSYTIISLIATGIFVYAEEVIGVLYSNKYISGVPVFRVYALVLLFRSTYFGMLLNATGKTKLIFKSSILSLGSNVILNFIFYYYFGFVGPAIATLLATLISSLYQIMATSKTINIAFKDIFPWKGIMVISLINLTFGVGFAFAKQVLPIETYYGEIVESIGLGLIWSFFYILLNLKKMKSYWDVLNSH
jgi:O-antigen/teichoic acid export membrane protein